MSEEDRQLPLSGHDAGARQLQVLGGAVVAVVAVVDSTSTFLLCAEMIAPMFGIQL